MNLKYAGEKIWCHWMDCFAFETKDGESPFEDCFLCNRNEMLSPEKITGDWYKVKK